jgi:hypothetical protein
MFFLIGAPDPHERAINVSQKNKTKNSFGNQLDSGKNLKF